MWIRSEGKPLPAWFRILRDANGGGFPESPERVSVLLRRLCEEALEDWDKPLFVLDCVFAGRSARLRIGGDAEAEEIAAPFSHLRRPGPVAPQIDLHVDLWDAGGSARLVPGPAMAEEGQPWCEWTEKSPDGRFVVNMRPNTIACLDRRSSRISAAGLWRGSGFVYEKAKPLARPLADWHNDQGAPIVHGGLVALGEKGILLGGRSGAGKSTTALACLLAGFDFLGEDFAALERLADGGFRGHGVYSSAFLATNHLAKFPELAPFVVQGRGPFQDKSAVLLSRFRPGNLRASVLIRALAVCEVAPAQETVIRRMGKAKAILALAPSTLFQIPSPPRRIFGELSELVERVPVFHLQTGHDLDGIAPVLADAVRDI